jgi:hypothetical protein
MKKTLGDYRKTINCLSEKDFNAGIRSIVLNRVRNIERTMVNTLPNETKLPKKAEKLLRDLEKLAKE